MAKNRIKELRNSANPKITLKELSDKLKEKGLSFTDSQLSYYENGTRSPRNEQIWGALAEIFDVDKLYLMGFSDKKAPGNPRVSLEHIESNLQELEKELRREHNEEEKNLLIGLREQMLELKNVILNAEIKGEKLINLNLEIENLEKEINEDEKEAFSLAVENLKVLFDGLSDENFELWLNLGYKILKSQSIDD